MAHSHSHDTHALAALLMLLAVVLPLKPLALAVSVLRYGRSPSWTDVLGLYGADSAVLLVCLAAAAWPAMLVARLSDANTRGFGAKVGRWYSLLAAAAIGLVAVFYTLAGYAFWEWGAFLTRWEVKAALRAKAVAGFLSYVFHPKMLIVLLIVVTLFLGALFLHRWLRTINCRRLAIMLVTATVAAGLPGLPAWFSAQQRDPALASPVLCLLSPESPHADGIADSGPRPPAGELRLETHRPVAEQYMNLRGKAAGMDVIIIIVESARRDRLALYGYHRDTMPTLGRMAGQGAVFQRAYVNQPRSCKTMASLMLGVYPDPRLRALTWQDQRLRGHESLPSILRSDGYSLFFGIMADRNADGYTRFLSAISGDGFDRAVGFDELGPGAQPSLTTADDLVLIDDFMRWYSAQSGPRAAVLWLAGAHFPYHAVHKTFPEKNLGDRYDNTLYSSDLAIDQLFVKLERLGRLDQTLVLVLGDHGEALGDKTGDSIHGKFFYDHSVRVPCLLINPHLFPRRIDVTARFQIKDLPATLLYLLGHDRGLRQSVNIFAKDDEDAIFMSNVFQGFKLAKLSGQEKFIYRHQTNSCYLFDLAADPDECINRIGRLSREEIRTRQQELVQWYYSQIEYLEKAFPLRR